MKAALLAIALTATAQGQDQSTDANLNQANNDNENSELTDVDDTNIADSQAIPEGFTPWNGTECPVPLGTMVDVILQTGDVVLGNAANDTKELFLSDQRVNKNGWWNRTDYPFDIIAYRLSEPTTDNVYQAENSDQLDEKLDIPAPAYNPPYEMMGSALIDDVVAVKPEIPPPQYHPEEVAFRKSGQFYTFDDANETWETLTDAISAARDYVEKHGHMVMVFTTRNIATVSPIVASQVEYL